MQHAIKIYANHQASTLQTDRLIMKIFPSLSKNKQKVHKVDHTQDALPLLY